MDRCEQCLKNKDFACEVCSACGAEAVQITLDGACLIGTCQKCGWSYVGSSFFMPCEVDREEYRFKLQNQECSKELLRELGRAMRLNFLELRKQMNGEQYIDKAYNLQDAMEIQRILQEKNIQFLLEPVPEYGRYNECKVSVNTDKE